MRRWAHSRLSTRIFVAFSALVIAALPVKGRAEHVEVVEILGIEGDAPLHVR